MSNPSSGDFIYRNSNDDLAVIAENDAELRRSALEIVAKHVAAAAIRGDVRPEWENYPDIGEHDWEAITCWLESHASSLDSELATYHRAYDLLAARAER